MAIRTKNLNLIPLLQALLEEENVAKAADKMALSQPAMSAALARLRDAFDDELMVRNGRSMQLTPRANNLKEQLNKVCTQIDLLFQPESFDPSTAEINFRIACPHYISFILVDSIMEHVAKEAPGISLDFVNVPNDLPHWLANSVIDIGVCADFGLWPDLPHEHLFRDRVVAIMSNNHPLNSKTTINSHDLKPFTEISMNENASAPFSNKNVVITSGIPSFDSKSQFNCMSQFTSIFMALKSNAVTRVPASLADRITSELPLTAHEISGEKTEFNTGIYWNKNNETSLEHQWLRSLIRDHLKDLQL